MKRVLVLGAPVFQIPVIQKAKEMGLYVGVVDIDREAPALCYADEQFICSIRDKDAVLRIAKVFEPDGIVIGACDTSVVTGAYVCSQLNLPGHTLDTAVKATDKVKMLETFRKHGVAHPFFQVVKKKDIERISTDFPYPVISKPIDSAGGRGISIIHHGTELRQAALFSSQAGISGDILIEEYMDGPEVSVEVIVVEGIPYVLQITDKITSGEPNFYELGHSQPSALAPEIKEQIGKLAAKAVLAVGLVNSPAHVEIKVTEEGLKMVELGARLGGDCITTHLLETSVTGINMVQAAIELALGKKPDVSSYTDSGVSVGIRFIPAQKGTLKSINGIEAAQNSEGVIKLVIIGKVGNLYSEATDDSARFGYVICKGASTEEAQQRCLEAIKKLRFEIQ